MMDKIQLISSVKEKIGSAQVDEALGLIVKYLEQEKRQYQELARLALQVQSQFQKVRNDEIKGIIDADDARIGYNQVTDRLLSIVDAIEQGRKTVDTGAGAWMKRYWPFLFIFLLAAGFFIVRLIQRGGESAQAEGECPVFDKGADFNVMVLPFKPLDDKLQNIHVAVRERFGQLSDRYGVNINTELFEIDVSDSKLYPNTARDAARLGVQCAAGLVIWGTTEIAGDRTIAQTRYKFVSSSDQFAFKKLNWNDATQLVTVTTLSSIAADGILTERLEQAIFLLLGIAAHNAGREETAIALLELAETIDSASTLLKGMFLADSYIATDNMEKALEAYDTVLQTHPNYAFALNNRGILNYSKGNYAEAVEDLTNKIQLDSSDVQAWMVRGSAFLKTEQLEKARQDLSRAKAIKPENEEIKEKWEDVNQKIRRERIIQERAETTLQQDPANVSALTQQAESSWRLGDFQKAAIAAEALIQRQPDNVKALSTLVESYIEIGKPEKAVEIIDKAKSRGIDQQELLKNTKVSPRLLERRPPVRRE
jgi:tetratricopeptide (TPR) repeat protein